MIDPPKAAARLRLRRSQAAWVLAAVIAVLLLTASYGARHMLVSPQGSQCLRAAWSLATTGALDVTPGRPFAWFGPLYPVTLAGLALAGLTPLGAVALVNSIALVATIALLAVLARRMMPRSAFLAPLFFAGLASNAYLFRMARPDIVMLPASLLAILGLARYAEHSRRTDLLIAAAGVALATTARYMAIFALAPLVAVGVHLVWRRVERGRAATALIFLAAAYGPVASWLLRNRERTGYLTGMSRTAWREQAAATDFTTNVYGLVKTFVLDLFGVRSMGVVAQVYGEAAIPYPVTSACVAAVAIGLALLGCGFARRGARPGPEGVASLTTRLVRLAAGSYLVALLVLWTLGNNDPIHTRYVAPVYGYLVLLAFRSVTRFDGRARIAFALAALAILGPNLDKSARLLGESPGDALIRVSLHREEDLWVRDLRWEDVMTRAGRSAAEP